MLFAIPALLTSSVGCEPGPIYGPDAQRLSVGSITPRSTWTASGNLDMPDLATDGNLNTMAVGRTGNPPPSLRIDLGQACTFNFVVVDHGRDELAFARRVEIATSMDGRTFSPCMIGPGTRRVSNFMLPKTALARYIRITAIEPGAKPLAVAEVYLQ
jgi:hypothetical protein